jgi:hypothetical protein
MHALVKLFLVMALGGTLIVAQPMAATAERTHANHACTPGEPCLSPRPVATTDEPTGVPFGTYSYLHDYLHSLGVINRLLQATNKSCCDGGHGGECRATELSPDNRSFKHGDRWCPLAPNQKIYTNIGLPNDVQAVVCAPYAPPDTCPITSYCVGATFSG